MTEQQVNFLKVAKEYEALKEQMSKAGEVLTEALKALPLNSYLQDPETGLVYKVVIPTGTFIAYKAIDYVRTKKAEERQGSLAAKEAQAAGFVI
jgi:hypothetical protein